MNEETRGPEHTLTRFARRAHATMSWLQTWSALFLAGLAATTLVLVLWSLEAGKVARGEFFHRIYLGIQMLAFNWSSDEPPENAPAVTLLIWLARLAALGTALFAAMEIIGRLFTTSLQRIWITAWYREHVVVCGLDSAGCSLCAALVESGCAVVAIHPDEASPHVSRARRRGVLVHVGDPLDPEAHEAVRAQRAAWVAAFQSGGAVASVVSRLIGECTRPRRYLMARPPETVEPQPMLVSEHRHSNDHFHAIRVNLHDRAASYLIADVDLFRQVLRHATLRDLAQVHLDPRRVLVAGDSLMAERLFGQLAWEAAVVYAPVARRPVLELGLAHPKAKDFIDAVRGAVRARVKDEQEIPALSSASLEAPLESTVLAEKTLFETELGRRRPRFDTIFVCCPKNEQTLALAEAIARRFTEDTLPFHPLVVAVFEEFEEGDSVPPALKGLRFGPRQLGDPRDAEAGAQPLLSVYDCWQRTLTAARLLSDSLDWGDRFGVDSVEEMAIRTNLVYENRAGVKHRPEEARRLWQGLDESLKESNRQFVRDIDRKLTMVGCNRVQGRRDPRFEFTPVEIECLARAEHERWLIERWERGWSRSLSRDIARKLSSNLMPWHELDEPTREIDRAMIRGIPEILAPEFRVQRG